MTEHKQETSQASQPHPSEHSADTRGVKWFSFIFTIFTLMVIGMLGTGNIGGQAIGSDGTMGCGGGTTSPRLMLQRASGSKKDKERDPAIKEKGQPKIAPIGKVAKVLPLPLLLKKIKKDRQARLANPVEATPKKLAPKLAKTKAHPKVEVLPLEQLLQKIKKDRLAHMKAPKPARKKVLAADLVKAALPLPLPALLEKLKQQKNK